jgi:hypothetical protein
VLEHLRYAWLWSEAAVPCFLAVFWLLRKANPTRVPDFFLLKVLGAVCYFNAPDSKNALPSPYYSIQEVLESIVGFPESRPESLITDDFDGESWTLESLLHLYVRQDWKKPVKLLWPRITHIGFQEFEPRRAWQFFKWHNEVGTTITSLPPLTKDWMALKAEAADDSDDYVPRLLRDHPPLVLLFLLVMPHRLRPGIVRWLSSQFRRLSEKR